MQAIVRLFNMSRRWAVDRQERERLLAERPNVLDAESWRRRSHELQAEVERRGKELAALQGQVTAKVGECSALEGQLKTATDRISELELALAKANSVADSAKEEAGRAHKSGYKKGRADGYNAGVEYGRKVAVEDAFRAFESLVPKIEEYGAYRFSHSPAYERASVVKGTPDYENGFELCMAQIKALGLLPVDANTLDKIGTHCPDPRQALPAPGEGQPTEAEEEEEEEPIWANMPFGWAIEQARSALVQNPEPEGMPEPILLEQVKAQLLASYAGSTSQNPEPVPAPPTVPPVVPPPPPATDPPAEPTADAPADPSLPAPTSQA